MSISRLRRDALSGDVLHTILDATGKRFSRDSAEVALRQIQSFRESLGSPKSELVSIKKRSERFRVLKELSARNGLDLELGEKKFNWDPDVIDYLNLEAKEHHLERVYQDILKANELDLKKSLEFVERPLKVISGDVSRSILEGREVFLPRSTLQFFKSGIAGKFPRKGAVLGEGTFGKVCESDLEHYHVACKEAVSDRGDVKKHESCLDKETAALMSLKHSNIIPVEAVDGKGVYLQKAFGSLKKAHEEKSLKIEELVICLRDIANALSYIHGTGLVYGDLKPSNILYVKKSNAIRAFLCDFGKVRSIKEEKQKIIGSWLYTAPEILVKQTASCDFNVDTFAFGVLVYELVMSTHPYGLKFYPTSGEFKAAAKSHFLQNYKIDKNGPFKDLSNLEQELITLAAKCLHGNPTHRPSMKQVGLDIEKIIALPATEELFAKLKV